LFSISAWADFIFDRLINNTIFITVMILLILGLFKRKEFKNTNMFRFIYIACIITLFSRYIYYVMQHALVNTRYLYPLAFYSIVLCVPGFFFALKILSYFCDRFPKVKKEYLSVALIAVIGIAGAGKALNLPKHKEHITQTIEIIKCSNGDEQPVLISNLREKRIYRIAWDSKARPIRLSAVTDINNPVTFPEALRLLKTKRNNVFVLVNSKDLDFRKLFAGKSIEFPPDLTLVKEYKEKRRRFYCLYEYKP
jgi:hypothetical protein